MIFGAVAVRALDDERDFIGHDFPIVGVKDCGIFGSKRNTR